MLDSFYETLGELLTAVSVHYDVIVPMIYGGVGYGETFRFDVEPTAPRQKHLHVVITRMETGRYELVSYRL
jgi:hypothetical protein